MAEIVSMPKLGFDMAEGTLARWVKAEGEPIEKGAVLAEIETDKATVEVQSDFSGVVGKHLVEQGASVPIGTPIAVITAPGEAVPESAAAPVVPAASPSTAIPSAAPSTPAAPQTAPLAVESTAPPPPVGQPGGRVHSSPLARRLARDNALDLASIQGSGPNGRVVRRDIENFLQAKGSPAPAAPLAPVQPAAAQPALPLPAWGAVQAPPDQVIQVDRLRAAIGRRMSESKQQLPHFYVTHEYDVDALLNLRKEINALLPEEQKISVNDFIVKAVALALRQFSNLNASISGGQITRHGHVNIGIAVAVPGGLLTIVNKDTDQKPLRLISLETREMAARARAGKVRPEDIEGSTFSISNLGMFDVENFAAIINPPEVAILAVASARQAPVVVDGELKVGMRMKATLSADHRVTDGAEAAQFMKALEETIHKPLRLLV
jgi:pyruvate dehydrogenase E2 component (dihydrolipoamide acetyltransferase)